MDQRQSEERQTQRNLQEVSRRRPAGPNAPVKHGRRRPGGAGSITLISKELYMRLVIGSDHAGWSLKATVLEHLATLGHDVSDIGCFDHTPVDFPDIARLVASEIVAGRVERGIMVCGTGVGASIAANKIN